MVFNTFLVGAAVTPSIIETSISHYLNRKPLRHKPTAHISYHVGLNLVRQFLTFASHHTVDEVQTFTSQWVPTPAWVRTEDVEISEKNIKSAATHLQTQLGTKGVEAVGGATWWQWRREGVPLKAEWIEMRKDYALRKHKNEESKRVMLYVHGGAYFFGSVDEHRYQMQRHARKLQARVFAPRYRLSPQFPFPCGLLDCLASYLELLETQPPETIVLAGDSAGGGMVVSLLVVLRDQGLPLPAGAVLVSPWVDLTHSFPSVTGDNKLDYIPAHGFLQRPSISWPPPNCDDLEKLERSIDKPANGSNAAAVHARTSKDHEMAAKGFTVTAADPNATHVTNQKDMAAGHNLSITVDGKLIEIKDQIQMYATNALISHPLVSPVLQPSLGGLPPLFILVGGGEVLRDEQIYLAHKAAAPSSYPPSDAALEAQGASLADIEKFSPTNVQLQVWDDMCHVAPTLSFTRPAKYMYRSVAQFAAWALARAQNSEIRIMDDDSVSIISGSDEDEEYSTDTDSTAKKGSNGLTHRDSPSAQIGKAGDALPKFVSHMIRQRVTRHGEIYPLVSTSSLPACHMKPDEVGTIKPGPVRKWMAAQQEWSTRYAKDKRRMQARRMKEMSANGGYEVFEGEKPPPTALAGRRQRNYKPKRASKKKSKALALWSGWGSKHDEDALEREENKDTVAKKNVVARGSAPSTTGQDVEVSGGQAPERPGFRTRAVSDEGQTGEGEKYGAAAVAAGTFGAALAASKSNIRPTVDGHAVPFKLAVPLDGERNASTMTLQDHAGVIRADSPGRSDAPIASNSALRPAINGLAFPFKLGAMPGDERNASTMTLHDHAGVIGADSPVKSEAPLLVLKSTLRPTVDGLAVPFKLGAMPGDERNASTMTLHDHAGVIGANFPVNSEAPLLASKSTLRPTVDSLAVPFKLGAMPGDERNASTMTLHDHAGVIGAGSPIQSDLSPETPIAVPVNIGGGTAEQVGSDTPAVDEDEDEDEDEDASTPVQEMERPGVERFVTADELPRMGE